MALSDLADRIAKSPVCRDMVSDGDNLRDVIDIATGSDLDCVQLDILTDMVGQRMRRAEAEALYNLVYAHTVVKYDPEAGIRCCADALARAALTKAQPKDKTL